MLLSLGHGQKIVRHKPGQTAFGNSALVEADAVPETEVVGAAAAPTLPAGVGRFGYMFVSAPGPGRIIESKVLDLLADAMADGAGRPDIGAIAPIFTYFGQFIDHDITANTDNDIPGVGGRLTIDQPVIKPVPRDLAVSAVTNLRTATLRLDSLYGDGPANTGLEFAMREPNSAKMRLGDLAAGPPTDVPIAIPADGFADLPRVGPLVPNPIAPNRVPRELISEGHTADESRKALIGDSRNDENLIVAQLHVAFLRFHNAVANALQVTPDDAGFRQARKLVEHVYQWLAINAYLPAVADKAVVDEVMADEAPLYGKFYDAVRGQLAQDELPMPLEFSVAGFRYGHSLIRAAYDYNANFTGPRAATFRQLFEFTGNTRVGAIGTFDIPKLPNNWPIDWSRFLGRPGDQAFRFARAIDTALAPPLAEMVNQPPGDVFRNLARRNLRRGWLLNIPTGQAVAQAMTDAGKPPARVLDASEVLDGTMANSNLPPAEKDRMSRETPLWFYILREAEKINGGARLGPVGSRIVAETLVGLVVNDQSSYWHLGAGKGSWTPDVNGAPIRSMEDFLTFAGVL